MTIRVSPSAENVPGVSGQSGKYLTTDGQSLSWGSISAGGMTLLSTTTLSGTSTTISNINQTYNSLLVLMNAVNINTTGNFTCNPNNEGNTFVASGVSNGIAEQMDTTLIPLRGSQVNMTANNTNNAFYLIIHNYSINTSNKPVSYGGGFITGTNTNTSVNFSGQIRATSVITSLKFETGGNSFNSGTVRIYGVK